MRIRERERGDGRARRISEGLDEACEEGRGAEDTVMRGPMRRNRVEREYMSFGSGES